MAAKLTRLAYKIAIQLHLVAESIQFAVLTSGDQSGNFWIHFLMLKKKNPQTELRVSLFKTRGVE